MPGGLVSAEKQSCLFPMEIAASELLWYLHVITPGVNAPFTAPGTQKHLAVPGPSCPWHTWGFCTHRGGWAASLSAHLPGGPPQPPPKPARLLWQPGPGTSSGVRGNRIRNIFRGKKPFHTWLTKRWLLFLNNSFSVAGTFLPHGAAAGCGCAEPRRPRPGRPLFCSGPAALPAAAPSAALPQP